MSETSTTEVAGIRLPSVAAWLDRAVGRSLGSLRFEMITGGHSNLTYKVDAADGSKFVLRRAPLGHVLASAHDMSREHRIIAALQDSPVPVAPVVGLCDDPEVNDAPFYVMEFVDGLVVRDLESALADTTPPTRAAASLALVDTMAAIHNVDLAACGLDTLGKHEGYIARQLKRWYGQWQQQRTRELPAVDRVWAQLCERIPEQGPATLVHGDYRLDNCIIHPDGRVAAVLDWELCTLGDPLADLGLLQVYWTGPTDTPSAWTGAATTAEGFANRGQLVDHYAAVTGRDVSQLPFYVSFAYWKLACILEGVYARYLGGALGQRNADELAPFEAQVRAAAERAESSLAELQ